MFTGIIKALGEITSIETTDEGKIFEIKTKLDLSDKKTGDSIAIDGACVTITEILQNSFKFDAMTETLQITNFKNFKEGTTVNLEPAVKLKDALDGHITQGHVDTTTKVMSLETKDKKTELKIEMPKKMSKYIALKGSISINGVSLTISDLRDESFSVDLIPHTLKETNLSKLKKGDIINIEIDVLARYLERLLNAKESETKYEFLKERGFI
jgi:riboflavin synthase